MKKLRTGIITLTVASSLLVGGAFASAAPMEGKGPSDHSKKPGSTQAQKGSSEAKEAMSSKKADMTAKKEAMASKKEEMKAKKKAMAEKKEQHKKQVVTDTLHGVETTEDGQQVLMIGTGDNAAEILLTENTIILVNGEKTDASSLVAGAPLTVIKNKAGEAFLVIQLLQPASENQTTEGDTSHDEGTTTPDDTNTTDTENADTVSTVESEHTH
ncbi:hypothetical protein [Desulforamulus putei]|uniref:Pilus formation protein N terminal region n=1 Tax=Desulforamulus putei DSM 12395 TaxID=1121429 RepID=A0A1M4U2L4_9FIRM|nr:hypothetical protein [Desulforamulus putei]SHE51019.1 hypothetical protein SAMN02745133_00560 [Desulforamulus putei DSM 12395]